MLPGFNAFNRYMYVTALVLTGISLVYSRYTLSIAMLLLAVSWILEGKPEEKVRLLKANNGILLLISIYLLHVIFLLNTSDMEAGFKELRLKLPILAMPLIIGSSRPLNRREFKWVLIFFILAVLVSSFISMVVLSGMTGKEVSDTREIVLYISHIRFALLINITIFVAGYFLFFEYNTLKKSEIWYYAFSAAWLIFFLYILKSLTGIVVFMGLAGILIIYGIVTSTNKKVLVLSLSLIFLILILGAFQVIRAWNNVFGLEPVKVEQLDAYTEQGNPYTHRPEIKYAENGHYTWLYVCEKELREKWNERSELDYDGKDEKGHDLKYTLIRYLTSKGLRKDAEGMAGLSEQDITNIENGMANHIFQNKYSLYPKIYRFFWEINRYMQGDNPGGHSISLRLYYYKTAVSLIRENFWFGTGTGDALNEFYRAYEESPVQLKKRWQHTSHNQFLTFFVMFGVFGMLWFAFAIIAPVFTGGKHRNYFVWLIFITALLSMINEDTLETHIGVSLVFFFYALFLYGIRHKDYKTLGVS